MATPFKDAEAAIWAWVTADPGYSALGLIEYRGYDGRVMPFDAGGPIAGADLPGIGAILTTISTTRRGPRFEHTGRMTWQIVDHATGHPSPRDTVEAATVLVQARLNSGEALRDKWGAPGTIATGELIPDMLKPWTPRERGTSELHSVVFWEGRFHFEFTLKIGVG